MPSGLTRSHERPTLAARILGLWPYVLVAFLYFATSPYHAGLNNPNEMVRVYLTQALVVDGTFTIDSVVARWGGVDDKAVREGHLYSSKAPLHSLIGVPPLALVGTKATPTAAEKRQITTVLRRTTAVIPGILLAWALLAWSRRRAPALGATERQGTAVGLTLALGTMLYPYALTFTGHILAAFAAGGAYLVAVWMSRVQAGSIPWVILAVLLGALGGAAPFAEYPSALIALPALLAAVWCAPDLRRRLMVVGLGALGGALPFGLGLWAHQRSWGSPFATGYAFLENKAYVEVHKTGFFGVGTPKLEAFLGSLYSPGTGLLFYSPVLVVGVLVLVFAAVTGRKRSVAEITLVSERALASPLRASLAVAALVGVLLELLFISGHNGWRGGWTVGPRYIIAVAPVLGLWVLEALALPWARRVVPPLAALSILITGSAAALYPHLSDVYTNPIITFLWPSYRDGYTSYGLAHTLGLSGHAANLVHGLPLIAAVLYVALADVSVRSPLAAVLGALRSLVVVALGLGLMTLIPERDAHAAQQENERLWGFWEPARPRQVEPGFLGRARDRWATVRVESEHPKLGVRPCVPAGHQRCQYGDEAWQHFGPEELELDGKREPILFMHPIAGSIVRAEIPLVPGARRAIVRYGLADASAASDNPSPVRLEIAQGDKPIGFGEAGRERGLRSLPLTLTSTQPLRLELRVDKDGARVFGFDVVFAE